MSQMVAHRVSQCRWEESRLLICYSETGCPCGAGVRWQLWGHKQGRRAGSLLHECPRAAP